jgi:hypothetical protein
MASLATADSLSSDGDGLAATRDRVPSVSKPFAARRAKTFEDELPQVDGFDI